MTLTSFILDALTWLSLAVVGLLAVAQLRDLLLQYGFVRRNGWLGRQASRGQASQVVAGLEALGLDDRVAGEIRATLTPPRRATKRLMNQSDGREDVLFLAIAKQWVYKLSGPYSYKGTRYYLDIMGAMADRSANSYTLDQIFAQWITRAGSLDGVEWVDAFLAPKDGNVALCQEVAARFNRPLILCKGEADKALVDRADPREPHETDFEGLRAFIRSVESKATLHGRRYSFWIIDDSCSGGSQLASIVRRFNRWLELRGGQLGWDVVPVDRAFVLFRANARGVMNDHLTNVGLDLHALVSLGEAELKLLRKLRTAQIANHLSNFKRDSFACSTSILMLGPSPAGPSVLEGTRTGRAFGLSSPHREPQYFDVLDKGVSKGEVRVAVTMVGLTGVDVQILRSGSPVPQYALYPVILGGPFAGVVADVGERVSGFKVGDSVIGVAPASTPRGALRDYITVTDLAALAKVPSGVTFHEAVTSASIGSLCIRAVSASGLTAGDRAVVFGKAPLLQVMEAVLVDRGVSVIDIDSSVCGSSDSGCEHPIADAGEVACFILDHPQGEWQSSDCHRVVIVDSAISAEAGLRAADRSVVSLLEVPPSPEEFRAAIELLRSGRLVIPVGRDLSIDQLASEIETVDLQMLDVVHMGPGDARRL